MRRFAFIAMAVLSGAAAAQSLLDCVDPDVLRTLMPQNQIDRTAVFAAAVPPELAALKMPGDFTWIGSAERVIGRFDATTDATQATAAWRTGLAVEAARTATATALTASGWEVREEPRVGMGVFFSAANPVTQSACREGRSVGFTVNALDGVNYVLLMVQRGSQNSICDQAVMPSMTTGMDQYLPKLALPVDPGTGFGTSMGGGGNAGGGAVSARAEFSTRESAASVARHFAAQMQDQGWADDATWSGETTAGSSWLKQDGDLKFHGTIAVTAIGNSQIVALLRVVKM